MEPASVFGLIKGVFDGIRGVFGAVVPKLELTYEAGKPPYVEADEYVSFAAATADAEGNVRSTTISSPRRWFRVGIKNRSMETVEDVRAELVSIEPDVIGHLPMALSIMHSTPQPLTVHRAAGPSYFADVILKLDNEDRMHLMTAMQTPRGVGGILAGHYRLGVRVTGRNTPAVTKHYVADVDDKHQLVFGPD
jgi:hypothetical protein